MTSLLICISCVSVAFGAITERFQRVLGSYIIPYKTRCNRSVTASNATETQEKHIRSEVSHSYSFCSPYVEKLCTIVTQTLIILRRYALFIAAGHKEAWTNCVATGCRLSRPLSPVSLFHTPATGCIWF